MRSHRIISVFLSVAMLLSLMSMQTVFADTNIVLRASERFGNFETVKYDDFSVSYNTYAQSGKAFAFEKDNPIYGNMFAFAQTAQAERYKDSIVTFGLKNPIDYSEATDGQFVEFSFDLDVDISGSTQQIVLLSGTSVVSRLTVSDTYIGVGATYVGKEHAQSCIYTDLGITDGYDKNITLILDLKNKKVQALYVNGVQAIASNGNKTAITGVAMGTADKIDSISFNWGNSKNGVGSNGYTFAIDNINIIAYTSADGTSPLADKSDLRELITEMYNISGLDPIAEANLEAALQDATETYFDLYATQQEVNEAYEALDRSTSQRQNESFTLRENFEGDLSQSAFTVSCGGGFIETEVYEDTYYGQGTLKLKSDISQINVSQYVDFGFGSRAINCAVEDPGCYVEFGVDFSSYNMSTYSKNIFFYFAESSGKNLAYLYITGGNKIVLSGTPDGDIILGSIEDPAKMKNIRVLMQMTDLYGNTSQKVIAIYADGQLLSGNYPISLSQSSRFDKIRVLISNVKEVDFGQNREWGTNIDNMTVTKYYSLNGESDLHTAGELVSLMRSYEAEALSNYQNGTYNSEHFALAQDAIKAAAFVYMNSTSTDEQIDSEYKALYSTKKRLALSADKTFDVVDISTSVDEIKGNDEVSVNLSLVTSYSIAQAIAPTIAGILMKNSETADSLIEAKVKTIAIDPGSAGELSLNFDVSEYTDEAKADMYIKLLVFESISDMKLADIEPTVLFGVESEINNDSYRYTSDRCAYQLVKDNVISVFTSLGEKNSSSVLFLFKFGFDYMDFSDEALSQNLVYVNATKSDRNGKCAFDIQNVPIGEYSYCLNGKKGKFVSSSAIAIENAFNEVTGNTDILDANRYILGIDEEAYDSASANEINMSEIMKSTIEDKSYTVSELQTFAEAFIRNINMINDFKSAQTTAHVRAAIDEHGSLINNIAKYTLLSGNQKSIAEAYILNNRDQIISINTLRNVIENAELQAKKQNNTGGTNGSPSASGGGSYPSDSVKIAATNISEKEYGVITDVHTSKFTDLENYEWAKPAIALLVKKGSVNGKSNGVFAPSDYITREEFVKMLLLTFEYKINASKSTFADVDNASWYAPYVMSIVNLGLANGISDNMFGTGVPITREDAAVLLARVLEDQNIAFTEAGEYIAFADDGYISDYAYGSVIAMTKSGIINGMEHNRFAPQDNATRAEAAKLIYEAYMFMVSKEA